MLDMAEPTQEQKFAADLTVAGRRVGAFVMPIVASEQPKLMSEIAWKMTHDGLYSTKQAGQTALSGFRDALQEFANRAYGQEIWHRANLRHPYSVNPDLAAEHRAVLDAIVQARLEDPEPEARTPRLARQNQKPAARESLGGGDPFGRIIAPKAVELLKRLDRYRSSPLDFMASRNTGLLLRMLELDPATTYSSDDMEEGGISPAARSELNQLARDWFGVDAVGSAFQDKQYAYTVNPALQQVITNRLKERMKIATDGEAEIEAMRPGYEKVVQPVNSFLEGKTDLPNVGSWSLATSACVYVSLQMLPTRVTQISEVNVRVLQLNNRIETYLGMFGYREESKKDVSRQLQTTESAEYAPEDLCELMEVLLSIQGDVAGLGRKAIFAKLGYMEDLYEANPRKANTILKCELRAIIDILRGIGIEDVVDTGRRIRMVGITRYQVEAIRTLFKLDDSNARQE